MIRKESEIKETPNPNMRGGKGTGRMKVFFSPSEFSTPLSAFNLLTLEPGVSVGPHRHEGSEEIYFVLEGRGLAKDDGQDVELKPGDALLTCDGHSHSLENPGPGPLKILTVLSHKVKP